MKRFQISSVFLFSLMFRLWASTRLDFGTDQQAIYELGKSFYLTGVLPAEGPKLVYTGESIPGGFQAFLAGLPLFFSNGDPIGLQGWVGFLNWVAMGLLFFWLRTKIEKRNELILAFFLMFSPWSILFSPAWNPSFLPILSVPFFLIVNRVLEHPEKPNERSAWLTGFLIQLCLQLHLSAVLLGGCALLVLIQIRNRFRFVVFSILGFISGMVFLVPWLLKKLEGSASAPTGVLGFYPLNFGSSIAGFFRYFSFPTSEISRFIGAQGHGVSGMISQLQSSPGFWIPALIALSGSVILFGLSLKRWFKLGRSMLKRGGKLQKMELLEFGVPLLMPLPFLFSIKGASAHTFWILMPLSFYTMIMAANSEPMPLILRNRLVLAGYGISSVLLTAFALGK